MPKTCGLCEEFMPGCRQCGNPMVYLNHSDNVHYTTADTASCGFFSRRKEPIIPIAEVK